MHSFKKGVKYTFLSVNSIIGNTFAFESYVQYIYIVKCNVSGIALLPYPPFPYFHKVILAMASRVSLIEHQPHRRCLLRQTKSTNKTIKNNYHSFVLNIWQFINRERVFCLPHQSKSHWSSSRPNCLSTISITYSSTMIVLMVC